jgi:hypothetical protein
MLETIQGNYTIKQILKDDGNWERFLVEHPRRVRKTVLDEVAKVLACGNKDVLGYSVFLCMKCGRYRFVPHTCKSRFCNSCGKVMTDNWMDRAERELLNVPYYHVVFSPPSELWLLMAGNRKALGFLFKAASGAVLSWCGREGFVPGIVTVLHTFGSDLKFHPHIHMLLTLGGECKDRQGAWEKNGFFPERYLKTEFKRRFLGSLRGMAKKGELIVFFEMKKMWRKKLNVATFYEMASRLWDVIWYVYIGERLDNASFTARYIGRYAKRPCLSETNIVGYSKERGTVTFRYRDKMEKIDKTMTVPTDEFIGRLVRHVPEKGFQVIRYYGIYAKCVKNRLSRIAQTIAFMYSAFPMKFMPRRRSEGKNWQERIALSTGTDPLLCQNCNAPMAYVANVYKARDGPLKTVWISEPILSLYHMLP